VASVRTALGLTVATLAASASLAAAPQALANGDPASHVLLVDWVFIPVDAPVSKAVKEQLETVVQRARRAGYPIRVAIIGSPVDLGAIPSLFGKPQVYAKFLGEELTFLYKGRLLIVMPNGYGYYDGRGRSGPEQRVLRGLEVEEGADELVQSATRAVARLAAANGHPVAVPPLPEGGLGGRTLVAIGGLVAAGLLAFAIGLAVWLRRGTKLQDS
jgi:hypothetical protein